MHDYLMHYGILGMKWGVRRYQNPDGSLTAAGKKKYYKERRNQYVNDQVKLSSDYRNNTKQGQANEKAFQEAYKKAEQALFDDQDIEGNHPLYVDLKTKEEKLLYQEGRYIARRLLNKYSMGDIIELEKYGPKKLLENKRTAEEFINAYGNYYLNIESKM